MNKIVCDTIFVIFFINSVHNVFSQMRMEQCPMPKAEKVIPLKSMLGIWYTIRLSPSSDLIHNDGPPDCIVETRWSETETLAKSVLRSKSSNGTIEEIHGAIDASVKYDGYPLNTWKHTLFRNTEKNLLTFYELIATSESAPLTFLDTDDGKSWAIGYSCWVDEEESKNSTAMWFITSRLPTMDPKLEQSLVKKVLAYSPSLKSEDLYGIGHTDCY